MNYRKLAKLFYSSEINKFAQDDLSSIESSIELFPELGACNDVASIFEEAYSLLLKHYRNEYVVKNEITNKLLLGRHSMNTTTMLSELRTGNNIADCVLVNKESICYEIKTEFDSLARFKDQLESYLKVYEKTYVVTHNSHLNHVIDIYNKSPFFGIMVLTERNQLKKIIDAPISNLFDLEISFDTLRKVEYMHIAKFVHGSIPEMPNTHLHSFCKDAYLSLDTDTANTLFKYCLRTFRKNDHSFINSLPKSLKNVGISYQVSRKDKNSIIDCLSNKTSNSLGASNVLPFYERQTT